MWKSVPLAGTNIRRRSALKSFWLALAGKKFLLIWR
jgi:hypothetical protein